MEELLSEMEMVNKYNRINRKQNLGIGMESTNTGMGCVRIKYGNKHVITINFKGEMVDLFAPKHFDFKPTDLEKKFKKLDKGIILKVIDRKINYLDIDTELSTKY